MSFIYYANIIQDYLYKCSATVEKYRTLAKGGFGAIINGVHVIDEREKDLQVAQIWSDEYIREEQKIVNAVHGGLKCSSFNNVI
jgi:2,4-dienoyl-CoA reductase-like NADH-dependent reductase (Old Yellow Enzyme family)